MDNFKKATKDGLRVKTKVGLLSTEQLWELSIDDLNELAVSLDGELEQSNKKSFLRKKSVKDATLKLKFDIVLEILNTKLEEQEAASAELARNKHNAKIDAAIAEIEEGSLKKKTKKQLEAMRM